MRMMMINQFEKISVSSELTASSVTSLMFVISHVTRAGLDKAAQEYTEAFIPLWIIITICHNTFRLGEKIHEAHSEELSFLLSRNLDFRRRRKIDTSSSKRRDSGMWVDYCIMGITIHHPVRLTHRNNLFQMLPFVFRDRVSLSRDSGCWVCFEILFLCWMF